VIAGQGLLALTNATYRTRFKVDNPNLALLHQLKVSGVQLLVCSQAMTEAGFAEDAMTPDVTISLSALTDFAVFGQQGYSYMRL
jgi:intracellular sulfur oxidation DsrE/DsrF family protein